MEPVSFKWNAEEALKLLNRGYRIVLTQDGLGDITAVAIPKGVSLNRGMKDWRDFNPPCESIEDCQRSVFEGPNKYSGGGQSIGEALHSLTEKAVFNRLPDGKGGFYTPPTKPN